MKTVVLDLGKKYHYKGVTYEVNDPKTVNNAVADHLLSQKNEKSVPYFTMVEEQDSKDDQDPHTGGEPNKEDPDTKGADDKTPPKDPPKAANKTTTTKKVGAANKGTGKTVEV